MAATMLFGAEMTTIPITIEFIEAVIMATESKLVQEDAIGLVN